MLCVTTWVKLKGKRLVYLDLSTPLELIGRSREFQEIVEVLAKDGDLLIAGVPGSGRRTLVRAAAKEVNAVVMEIDCIRATDGERFVQLLAETISQNFDNQPIQNWVTTSTSEYFVFENEASSKLKLLRGLNQKQLWQAFEFLLKLPQRLAEDDDKRGVLILYAFPHIRSWDRGGLWEATFRREIKVQTRISYVLIATIAETNNHVEESNYPLEVLELAPLAKDIIAVWARGILHTQGLTFDPRSKALQLFLDAVQGHIGDAMALIRRLQGIHRPNDLITEQAVQEAIDGLLKDLSMTFESLLMLLPPNQVHLLESLACDPTEKPQSREYIQKHVLSRGGSLQGALIGLQHKGLIYSAEQRYQLALPLLALWLRQRLV
ncbi:ATP-binding protein [Brunnivagina elsteri]|uniref:ATP-binding protein n=1 Tax=Brunnivagina elsteri CCALA 953 TaxID=987040 RepID=A0A2A2TQG3_9CYAN|nr:ATP-binding protein [Calothrix elsteri]PAX60776.1 ATP-binding protein [Calothrix elsteri CCALA 953]